MRFIFAYFYCLKLESLWSNRNTMKYFLITITAAVIFSGCAANIDTTNLSADEHLQYAMNLYNDEDYLKSINEFQAILLQFPGNQITDDAQFYLGMSYFKSEQYLLGAYEFSKLIKDIPASEFVAESQFMLAESYYRLSPPYQLDQSYTQKAIDEFQAFIDFFPTNKKVAEAEKKIDEMNTKLAEKEYMNGVIYEKMEYYTAAVKYYTNVIEKFHDTKFAPKAMYRKINVLIDQKNFNQAVKTANMFLSRYPTDENTKEIEQLVQSLSKNS